MLSSVVRPNVQILRLILSLIIPIKVPARNPIVYGASDSLDQAWVVHVSTKRYMSKISP